MRALRAYSTVFSVTLLMATIPNGWNGVVHAQTLADAHYAHEIAVDERLWLMVGGFVIGTALAQALSTTRRRGRLRLFELCVALFLGMWISLGSVFALATAEWGGLALTLLSAAIAPLAPWTDMRASLRRKLALSALALAGAASIAFSSAYYLDSGFLFFLFSVPLVSAGGVLGILGAEHIVEKENRCPHRAVADERAPMPLRARDRSVA